ncbi:hypothetical protein LSAT2_025748 [Lamellibrachia satsuma]|nr:hypothetical protein LSAT2_025748 [Lamellibrachia satsuma]
MGLADVNIYTVGREWAATVASGRDGRFIITGVCLLGLKLTARKDGYESALQEYVVSAGSSVNIVMFKLEKPTFTVEPMSTAGFVGGTASFSCQATAEPAVTQYNWFKDGKILENTGTVYEITNLKKEDEGQYACRAASLGGKVFSRLASLVVKDAGAADTCDQDPVELVVELPPTCALTIGGSKVKSVNIGRCSNVPCVTQASPNTAGFCCVPSSTRQLHVECDGFSYEVSQAVACGCAECDDSNQITVTGSVKSGGASTTDVYALYKGQMYFVNENQFTFETTPQAGRIVFEVKSPSFMPRQVTVEAMEGVTEMFIEVAIVPKPSQEIVNAVTGGELDVESPGLPSVVSVTIPPKSFQDTNGDPVSSNVNVFVTFSDPRQPDGLVAAPGEFTFVDDEGEPRLLQTFGVVTLVAEDSNSNEVFLTGTTTMKFDAAALGMQPGDSVSLWSLDAASGNWKKSGEFTYSGGRRRRRDTTNSTIVEGETEIPPRVPYINFDKPIYRDRLCTIAIYVYYGAEFSVPMPGERLTAYMMQNGLFFGRTTRYTDRNGKACLLVQCGVRVIIRLESSTGDIIVHPTHDLPVGFPFTNRADGVELTPVRPTTDTNGPVYPFTIWNFDAAKPSDFHFMLSITPPRPSFYGSLNAVEMRPGFDNSWFPNPPSQREVCVVRVNVQTLEASKLRVVGISSAPGGDLYGTYSAVLVYDYETDVYDYNAFAACVLVRCPSDDVDYTAVDLQIAYKNRTQCRIGYSQLISSTKYGVTEYVSNTDSSLQLRVLQDDVSSGDGFTGGLEKRATRRDSGVGFYQASGAGDLAFSRVMRECLKGWNIAATFDCRGKSDDTTTPWPV